MRKQQQTQEVCLCHNLPTIMTTEMELWCGQIECIHWISGWSSGLLI